MDTIEELRKQVWWGAEAIANIKEELAEVGGELYRDCWLDSYSLDEEGQRRPCLWWFSQEEENQKHFRLLEEMEVARATKAIALWAELAWLEREELWIREKIHSLEGRHWSLNS